MVTIKEQLNTYCELHWWNGRRKTLDFKGELRELLKQQQITFTKRKTDRDGIYMFRFKCESGIVFKKQGVLSDFKMYAKQVIQMELVWMDDKSTLYVQGCWRPTVTVNH